MAVLKVIEVLSSSETSWEDATQKAVAQAAKSLKHIRFCICSGTKCSG